MDGAREKILDAAGRVFAERGYKSATIRQICQAAEVNVAAVNYYFGDNKSLKNDVWSSPDGKQWTLETANAPWPARAYHAAVVHDDNIYVFGGGNYVPQYQALNPISPRSDFFFEAAAEDGPLLGVRGVQRLVEHPVVAVAHEDVRASGVDALAVVALLPDDQAGELLARLFPDRKVVMVNINAIAPGGGGIHCITQQQPA